MSPSRQFVQPEPRIVQAEARSVLSITPPSSRKVKSSRDRVLDAATAVFAARGYRGASTQRIAERAGVNQATVFRIFNSKRALYLKVLERKLGAELPPWLLRTLEANPDHEQAFHEVAERLEMLFDPTFIRLLLAGGLEQPQDLKKCLRPRLLTFYSVLGEYIQQRINSGALRDLDPASMARALVGMVFYERIFDELFGKRGLPDNVSERVGKTFTNIWLHGVLKH
jgi:TetR/AcrR family transcriptional regulator